MALEYTEEELKEYNKKYLKKYLDPKDYEEGLRRLEQGEPVQYIVGNVDFYGYLLDVNPNVLIPRFETEELVSKTITHLREFENPRIVDIGTGSGCIAIALKKEIPCEMEAVDISKKALEVARSNAEKNEADIRFLEGSLLDPLLGKYDCIISNPPYISYDEEIMDIVLKNEPVLALYAGEEGLACYDIILRECLPYLKEKFLLAFEIGDTQGKRLLEKVELYLPKARAWVEKDMQGRDRFLFVREG